MIERDLASPIGALIPPPIPKFVTIDEPVDPAIYTGFVGHWSGGDTFVHDEQPTVSIPALTDPCLNADLFVFPSPKPQTLAEAREAERLMTISVLHGAALPVERVDDRRIVLTEIEKLVQSMVGWREKASAAPGLPTLVIPPRTEPDGWVNGQGLVHPRLPLPDAACIWGTQFFVSNMRRFMDEYQNRPIDVREKYSTTTGLYVGDERPRARRRRRSIRKVSE